MGKHIETMDELLAYKESAEVQIQQLARQRKVYIGKSVSRNVPRGKKKSNH